MQLLKSAIFLNNSFGEWACRILISLNIILPMLNFAGRGYPENVLIALLLSFWLYVYKIKGIAIVLLLLSLFINYLHIGVPYTD